MAIITINDGFSGLGTLAGKRVKAVLAARDAAAAATAAAARANPDDAAAQERARVAAEAQAAEHASFWAAEAHKKSQEHGIRKAVSKAMDIREKIDPVARAQAFVQTARKEGIEAAKDDLQADYVKGPMRLMSKISPSMKAHYEHETRKVEMRDLKTQLDQTDDPGKRAVIVARLQALQKDEEKYAKQGAIARTVLSIVVMVVPVLQFLQPFISAANAAVSVAQGKQQYDAAKRAQKEGERQEAEAVAHMVANGVTREQALKVIQLLKNGVPAEAALKSVLAGAPAPAAVSQEWKPMKLETPEAAQAAFLQWLKGWNPEVYDAVLAKMDAQTSLAGYSMNHDTGMFEYQLNGLHGFGFWESVGTAVSNISNTAGSLLKTYYDKKIMDIQLKQLKAQQAPMPTPVAEKAVEAQAQTAAGGGLPGWVVPTGIVVGGGLLFLFLRKK